MNFKSLLKISGLLVCIITSTAAFAQSVAINTSGANADPSSMLDITSLTKGLLVPRMTSAQRDAMPATSTSLLIFNTTDNEYNFYNGLAWVPFGESLWRRNSASINNRNGLGGVGIGLTTAPEGNLHVTRGSLFGGTAVFQGTTLRSHFNYGNTEDTYIRGGLANSNVIISDINTSRVGIGTFNPLTKFHLMFGSSGTATTPIGMAIFESSTSNYLSLITPSATENGLIFGSNLVNVGGGIIYNNGGNPAGMQFRTSGNVTRMQLTNAGYLGVGTNVYPEFPLDIGGRTRIRTGAGSAGIWFNNTANTAVRNFIGNIDDNHAGIYGVGSGWSTLVNSNTGNLGLGGHYPYDGIKLSIEGANNTGIWLRSYGVVPYQGWNFFNVDGRNSNFAGGDGIAVSGRGHGIVAQTLEDNDVNTDHDGGFFVVQNFANPTSGPRALASVASLIDNTTYKIIGFGIVSTIVKDKDDKLRIMAAPEAPEAIFNDYGVGQLVNGKVNIKIDPILSRNILVDEAHPIKIFVQLEGDCNGVYVTNKSATGFDVIELKGGTSNVKFSWTLAANRADEKTAGGQLLSKYSDMRFKEIKAKEGSLLSKQLDVPITPPMEPKLLPRQN